MTITLRLVLLILALVCFILSALQIPSPRVNLMGLGLSLWLLATIAG